MAESVRTKMWIDRAQNSQWSLGRYEL